MPPKPVVLAILDGWGIAPHSEGNAITEAKTPSIDKFVREYPAMTLHASGTEVGLSYGEMGNSEVGHMNIGAGRVYYQTYPRIGKAIADGTFAKNTAFREAMEHVKERKSTLHLIGLIGAGNVHASQEHCDALLALVKKQKIASVALHAILDGRDTKFDSGLQFVRDVEATMKRLGVGAIATLSGRFYAMDRDQRWDRTEKAYRAMVEGEATVYATNAQEAISASYEQKIYDEEFVPTVIGEKGNPKARICDGDAIIFFNFRADRARQLTESFVLPSFAKFDRVAPEDIFFVTMTEYEKEIPVVVAFPSVVVQHCLAEVVSQAKLKQLHIAETEKYAHITFFLNGTVEEPFPGEERKIIPSPKVSTYDQAPEMSALKMTKQVIAAIHSGEYDVIFVNFANADMVSHTGDIPATIRAVECIDRCLGDITDHILAKDGIFLITADHGNAEEMLNTETGTKDKEHSTNPVPFFIIGNLYQGQAGPGGDPPDGDLSLVSPVGVLSDVGPTLLKILGVKQPKEMTGRALI